MASVTQSVITATMTAARRCASVDNPGNGRTSIKNEEARRQDDADLGAQLVKARLAGTHDRTSSIFVLFYRFHGVGFTTP